jgi:hypothetical protein
VIDVEHHALRAFEQDPPAETYGLVEALPGGLGIGEDLRRDGQQVFLELLAIRFG